MPIALILQGSGAAVQSGYTNSRGIIIAAVLALSGVLISLVWNAIITLRLARINGLIAEGNLITKAVLDSKIVVLQGAIDRGLQDEASENAALLEALKREFNSKDRYEAIQIELRQKGLESGNAKADALRDASYNLLTGLEAIAKENAKLTDSAVVEKIDKVLEEHSSFKDCFAKIAPLMIPDEIETFKAIERLAVVVILDVARKEEVRQGREKEMQDHAEQLSKAKETANTILKNFIPRPLREWASQHWPASLQ
jgi:hypothetical protein